MAVSQELPSSDEMSQTGSHFELIQPKEELEIDANLNFGTHAEFGIDAPMVATILVPGQRFSLYDARSNSTPGQFILADVTRLAHGEATELKVIGQGGSETVAPHSNYSGITFIVENNVSGLTIKNLHRNKDLMVIVPDPNPSQYSYPQEDFPYTGSLRFDEGRTVHAVDRIMSSPNYRPPNSGSMYGYYFGYQIIGRETRKINGGIDIGGSPREAIYVDGDSPELQAAFISTLRKIYQNYDQSGRNLNRRDILQIVVDDIADNVMRYDGDATKQLIRPFSQDRLMSLSSFVREGIGVCRHQALLAASNTEQLIAANILPGFAGRERNEEGGVHAWGVWTEFPGAEKVVMDAAQRKFVGTKEEARQQGLWPYERGIDDIY